MVLRWGIGIEHEFLIQDDKKILKSYDVLNDSRYIKYAANPCSIITAPVRSKLDDSQLREHAIYFMKNVDGGLDTTEMSLPDLLKLIEPHLQIYAGDKIVSRDCYYDVYEITIIPAFKRHKTPLNPLLALQSFAALRIASKEKYHKLKDEEHHPDYDVDGPFIETRSTTHHNVTVANVLEQLHSAEQKVLEVANKKGFKHATIYPWSGRVTGDKNAKPEYTGSYHVWLTLPHNASKPMTMELRNELLVRHATLVHLLQWVEPLLMTLYSGDPRALGTRGKYPRASMRAAVNTYAGYGTTPAKNIAHNIDGHCSTELDWFESDEDLINNRGVRQQCDPSWKLFMWVDGKKMPYGYCLASSRFMMLWDLGLWVPIIDGLDSYNRMGRGADIRNEVCEKLKIPIEDGYEHRWLRVKDTLELRFVKNNKVVRDVPINKKKWGRELVGIEFRAIDNMPVDEIDNVLRFIILVTAASEAVVGSINFETQAATLSDAWHDALSSVKRLGSHAHVHNKYINTLRKQLGLISSPNDQTMFEALNSLSVDLYNVYKTSKIIKLMNPKSKSPPRFRNIGQMAWEAFWLDADDATRKRVMRNADDAPYIVEHKRNMRTL